jgi:putative transposase
MSQDRGISDATFYNWRTKYGGLSPSKLRRLKQLEKENAKLCGPWPICRWTRPCCRTCCQKALKPSLRRDLVTDLMQRFGASQRQTCALLQLSRTVYRYESVARDQRSKRAGDAHQGK